MTQKKPHNPLPTLPMHLMMSMGTWLTSPFALQCAKDALSGWKPGQKNLPSPAELKKLRQSVASAGNKRAGELLEGIARYTQSSYARKVKEPPAIWRKGNARLLDYGAGTWDKRPHPTPLPQGEGAVVLFVPSLINRYYILDLHEERSLLRFMADKKLYPLVLDWGKPGTLEADFGIGDYVTELLVCAIDFLYKASGRPVALAGYCMGGVLALAAAQIQARQVASLALLATPWNFHCASFAPLVLDEAFHALLRENIARQKMVSADWVQSLFYVTDPFVFEQKFRRFAGLDPKSKAASEFVALEHWVNDGVPMTSQVAQDCLLGWAQENRLMKNQWKVASKKIMPQKLALPIFTAIPQKDHVVPVDCALPLTKLLKKNHIITPSSGHVSMVVGSKAKSELWLPLADWLCRNAT